MSVVKLNDVIFNNYFFIGGLFLSYLIYKIFNTIFTFNNFILIKHRRRGHSWRSIQCNKSIPYNIDCCVCSKLMLPLIGLFCECCAISACKRCHRLVDKKVKCKEITWPCDKPFYHNWVHVGTVHSQNANQTEDGTKKFFCSWCHRIMFSPILPQNESECDFQKYRDIIIPPTCVTIEKGMIINIRSPLEEQWEPLFVLANRKSGSNRGDEVLSLFRGLLNPIQVVDIGTNPPESVVRWLPHKCRILVAGGDGTVAWVLTALLSAPQVKAAVAILPMGTGNDLSRVLGWGPGCDTYLNPHTIINGIRQASYQNIDRWKVTIIPKYSRLRRLRSERVLYAYNYASIGVDAQVALDFHHARSQFLYRYANRTLNYIAYLFLGVGRVLDAGSCFGLERRMRVRVFLDGANGTDGANGMGDEDVQEQDISDGKLEVVGISSSFHIARLQCGLAKPFRFAQASKLKIDLECSCAMQVDGEPWMQPPATVLLERAPQALVLRAPHDPRAPHDTRAPHDPRDPHAH